jgi:hypothetical protein
MKLLRQALSFSNPRSLWHRPTGQCLHTTCECLGFFGRAFTFAIATTLCLVVVTFVILPVLASSVCDLAVGLGLDDRDGTLHNASRLVLVEYGPPSQLYQPIRLVLAVVPLGAFILSAIDLLRQLRQGGSPRVFWFCVTIGILLLIPFVPGLIVATFCFWEGAGAALVGWIFDVVIYFGAEPPPDVSLVLSKRIVKEVGVLRGVSSFYQWIRAPFTLLGIASGLTLWLLVCCTPLIYCYRQVRDDVKETLEEIQV